MAEGGLGAETWDLVVAGTGLGEAAAAAAAARGGARVLHVDPGPRYGGAAGALALGEFLAELGGGGSGDCGGGQGEGKVVPLVGTSGEVALGYSASERWGSVEVLRRPGAGSVAGLGESRDFSLDLTGPRVVLAAGELVDLLVRAGCHQYLEFQPVVASVVWGAGADGAPLRVPGSQAEVFRERSLPPSDKRLLMRFLKGEMASAPLGEEDATPSFEAYLADQGLPQHLRSAILYALALADTHQGSARAEGLPRPLSRQEGRSRVMTYLRSVGRFGAGQGAFLAPLWGSGELPQAFCRSCAVQGGVYHLNCAPEAAIIRAQQPALGEGGGEHAAPPNVTAVRLSTGDTVRCRALLLSPDIGARGGSFTAGPQGSISRAVCITDGLLQDFPANTVITFPPGVVGNNSVVHCLQSGAGTKIVPAGRGAFAFCTRASPGASARDDLGAAVGALLDAEGIILEGQEETQNGDGAAPETAPAGGERPRILMAVYYQQALGRKELGPELAAATNCAQSAAPDGSLTLSGAAADALKTFGKLFPGQDFFPEESGGDPELEEDREVADLLSEALKKASVVGGAKEEGKGKRPAATPPSQ